MIMLYAIIKPFFLLSALMKCCDYVSAIHGSVVQGPLYDTVDRFTVSKYQIRIDERWKRDTGMGENQTTTTQKPNIDGPQPTTTVKPGIADPTTQKPAETRPEQTTIKEDVAIRDDHSYYLVDYHNIPSESDFNEYWHELDPTLPNYVAHSSIQDAHRVAAKIPLTFDFFFYGHTVNSVTIATGGFLYVSEFLHQFLTASQYIAPLMGNFDSSIGRESHIHYTHDDEKFVVEWSNLTLQDHQNYGEFTFQVQLYKDSGMIMFLYKQIPVSLSVISEVNHPVRVGLADAFYWDIGSLRTIYTYHRVEVKEDFVKPNAIITLRLKKTCNQITDCGSCLNDSPGEFTCNWCNALDMCSDGLDRYRQTWVGSGCPLNLTQTDCSMMAPQRDKAINAPSSKNQGGKIVGAVFGVIIGVLLIVLIAFLVYGYRNPHTSTGQFLIRNRPTELARKMKVWKRSEEDASNNYRVNMQTMPNGVQA